MDKKKKQVAPIEQEEIYIIIIIKEETREPIDVIKNIQGYTPPSSWLATKGGKDRTNIDALFKIN